jgi:hypothetical protein
MFWETKCFYFQLLYTTGPSNENTGYSRRTRLTSHKYSRLDKEKGSLQGVSEELVHLGDLGGDGKVDGTVANLNNESTNDVGVDGVGDLELLALTNVLGLGNGGLEAVEGLVVQLLLKSHVSHNSSSLLALLAFAFCIR